MTYNIVTMKEKIFSIWIFAQYVNTIYYIEILYLLNRNTEKHLFIYCMYNIFSFAYMEYIYINAWHTFFVAFISLALWVIHLYYHIRKRMQIYNYISMLCLVLFPVFFFRPDLHVIFDIMCSFLPSYLWLLFTQWNAQTVSFEEKSQEL